MPREERLINAAEFPTEHINTGEDDYEIGFDDGVQMMLDEIKDAPTVDAVPVVRCKNCKYFERNHFEKINGFPIPIIVAHEICTKWSEGCKTSSEGYCFMGERKEGEQDA